MKVRPNPLDLFQVPTLLKKAGDRKRSKDKLDGINADYVNLIFIRIQFGTEAGLKSSKIRIWRSAPEFLVFEDAHGHGIWVVAGFHKRVGGGEEAPVHSLGIQESDLVDSGQNDLDVIGAHVLRCDT